MLTIAEKESPAVHLYLKIKGKKTDFPYISATSGNGEALRLPVFKEPNSEDYRLSFSFDVDSSYRPYKPNGDNTQKTLVFPNSWDDQRVRRWLRKYRHRLVSTTSCTVNQDTGVDFVLTNLVTAAPFEKGTVSDETC